VQKKISPLATPQSELATPNEDIYFSQQRLKPSIEVTWQEQTMCVQRLSKSGLSRKADKL